MNCGTVGNMKVGVAEGAAAKVGVGFDTRIICPLGP